MKTLSIKLFGRMLVSDESGATLPISGKKRQALLAYLALNPDQPPSRDELMALLWALSFYTAAFIAEIVRAGILAVSHGQSEAAHALGLRQAPTLRLVVIPQALRIIIPPLTSQYLNLTKNSSLATAIGYPDLVAVFMGTIRLL